MYAGIIHLNFQDHGRQGELPQHEESVLQHEESVAGEDNQCNWDDVVETSRETHSNCKQDIKDMAIISFVSFIGLIQVPDPSLLNPEPAQTGTSTMQ